MKVTRKLQQLVVMSLFFAASASAEEVRLTSEALDDGVRTEAYNDEGGFAIELNKAVQEKSNDGAYCTFNVQKYLNDTYVSYVKVYKGSSNRWRVVIHGLSARCDFGWLDQDVRAKVWFSGGGYLDTGDMPTSGAVFTKYKDFTAEIYSACENGRVWVTNQCRL